MITIDTLKDFGADVQDGVARCLNKEDFYLKMVNMGMNDAHFDALGKALQEKDFESAFEAAHALKGILGNLALTPILKPVTEITEHLRAKEDIDYAPLYEEIQAQHKRLLALA